MPTRTIHSIRVPLDSTAIVPGSKSIANRTLVCAALANGTSTVTNLPDGDDTVAMLDCLGALGITVAVGQRQAVVTGAGVVEAPPQAIANAQLAGTTSRFVAALAALSATPVILDGLEPLRRRPFGPLFGALRALGATIESPNDRPDDRGSTRDGDRDGAGSDNLPATITGPLSSNTIEMRGDVSSQFISALMMVAPRIDDGLTITLTTDLISQPYVALTTAVMADFGVRGVAITNRTITVPPADYRATDIEIEPDASSASYPLALAAMVGGKLTVEGLGHRSQQGDAIFADLLGRMGCTVQRTATNTTVSRADHVGLNGITVDMADYSDLVPTLAVVAAIAETPTKISGVGFIRHKESDRLGDLTAELRKVGVDITETDDGVVINPSKASLRPGRLATHHDHRLAMAFAVLGCVQPGIEIEDPEVVSKSWPGFWTELDNYAAD